MLKKILITVLLIAIAAMAFPTGVYACDPSDGGMDVTVSVGDNTDVTLNGTGDTDLATNGINSRNITVNGDSVITGTQYQNQMNAYTTSFNGQLSYKDSVINQQKQVISQQQDAIQQTRSELGVVEQAVAKLINQSNLSDQNLSALQDLLQKQEELTSELSSEIDSLKSYTDQMTNDINDELNQDSIEINQLKSSLQDSVQSQADLNNRISALEQDKYVRDHSGVIYGIKSFFSNVFQRAGTYFSAIFP